MGRELGHIVTDKTRNKIRLSLIGRKKSQEYKNKMKIIMNKEEVKSKISKKSHEMWKNIDHIKIMSKKATEFKNKPEEKKRMSKIATEYNRTSEQIERIKNLMKNPEISIKICGEKNGMFGKRGEKHPNWKGGKNTSNIRRIQKRKEFISNSLNDKFSNSEEHHIDKQTTIYLPKQIHSRKYGIIHNLHTGYCMNVINTLAYFFLVQQNIQELNKLFVGE